MSGWYSSSLLSGYHPCIDNKRLWIDDSNRLRIYRCCHNQTPTTTTGISVLVNYIGELWYSQNGQGLGGDANDDAYVRGYHQCDATNN